MINALLLLSFSALAADPTTPSPVAAPMPAPAPEESHISVIRQTGDFRAASTMAIVLSCQPLNGELGKKIGYTEPSYGVDSTKLLAAITPRSDIQTLVVMDNPSAAEVTTWLKDTVSALNGDTYRMVMISVACPAMGGDTDDERLLTREVTDPNIGGLPLAALAAGIAPLANSSLWLLDASRDLSAATGVSTYGPTADDITKFGLPDALAISSGPSGRYADANTGLLDATADVIAASNGSSLSLEAFYFRGVRIGAPMLELNTSMGLTPNDAWNQNMTRTVFVGGPLIASSTIVLPKDPIATTKRRIPPGYIVLGSGVAASAVAGVFAVKASNDYEELVIFNEEGAPSDTVLNEAANSYRANMLTAIVVGGIGALGMIGGGTWLIVDHGQTRVEVTPVGVHGTF